MCFWILEGLSLGNGGEPTKADLAGFLGDYAEPDQDMTLTRQLENQYSDDFDNPLYSEPDKNLTLEESRFDNSVYVSNEDCNNVEIIYWWYSIQ